MKIAIKNNKGVVPVQGMLSCIKRRGDDVIIGHVIYRKGITSRQVWSGTNSWDIFNFEMSDGYRAVEGSTGRDSLVLGRYDGQDISVGFERLTAEPLQLPNGFVLPAEYEPVSCEIGLSCPISQENANLLWDMVPFHEPGGPGSTVRRADPELYAREVVSYWALLKPAAYRLLAGKTFAEIFSAVEVDMVALPPCPVVVARPSW